MVNSKEMILERWDYTEKLLYEICKNTYEIIHSRPLPAEEISEIQCIVEHSRSYTRLYPVDKYVQRYKILLARKDGIPIESFAVYPTINKDFRKINIAVLRHENNLTEQFIKDYIEELLKADISEEKKLLISRDIYNYYIYNIEGRKDFCYAPLKIPNTNLLDVLKQSREDFLQSFLDTLNKLDQMEYIPIRERIKGRSYYKGDR